MLFGISSMDKTRIRFSRFREQFRSFQLIRLSIQSRPDEVESQSDSESDLTKYHTRIPVANLVATARPAEITALRALYIYLCTDKMPYLVELYQISMKTAPDWISEHLIFKIFLGEHAPRPPGKDMLCMPVICSIHWLLHWLLWPPCNFSSSYAPVTVDIKTLS